MYNVPMFNMALMMAAETFFAKQLISADPKNVVLSQKVQAVSSVPQPVASLQPGTYKYQAKVTLGGQEIAFSVSTTVKEENGSWTVTEVGETAGGPGTQTSTLEKSTLIVREREVLQGSNTVISLDFTDTKATGTINLGAGPTPVSIDIGGPLFADGPGMEQVIGCLPLAERYSATFRNLDLQTLKVLDMQLKVPGSEKITVPAGTFQTFRVEVAGDGDSAKSTIWIAKDTRKTVKFSQVTAQVGGATMTAELVE